MNVFQQLFNPSTLLGRGFAENGISAPILWNQAEITKLTLNPFRIGIVLIDLIHSHNNRNLGCLGMGNGLLGLIHYTVIGSNNQHNDIGNLGTTGTHFGKGSMTRGVNKGDIPGRSLDVIGSNMLGNSTCLTFSNIRLADGIQDRGLTMVDMPHDCDHRESGLFLATRLFFLQGRNAKLFGHPLLHLIAKVGGYQGCRIQIKRLVDGSHDTKPHKLCNNLVGLDTHSFGKITNTDGLKHLDPPLDGLALG